MTPRKIVATLRSFGLSFRRSGGGVEVEGVWCSDWNEAFAVGVEMFARRIG